MDEQVLKRLTEKNNRVQATIQLKQGDRVPFIPNVNNLYALHYDVTIKKAMEDNRNLIPAFRQYLSDYDPDMVMTPFFYPIKPMETAGYVNARWPGEYYGLPDDTPYQYVDHSYLEDDEYDDFLKDPSAFMMKKVFAQKYKNFSGMKYLDWQTLCGSSIFSLATFGIPEVKETLLTIIKAGEEVNEGLAAFTELMMAGVNEGYTLFGASTTCNPFDDFADHIRGLLPACMDLVTDPELVDEAVTRWGDVTIPAAVAAAKMMHQDYTLIPLHCGIDNFMSLNNYNKYYWPHLKRLLLALIDAGITPIVICEGKYYTRLETLTDVPIGKVMYMFEDVDFAQAKKILGNYACFGGGMKSQYLMPGQNPQRIRDEVKRLMDICAPGGGYFMCNSLSLDIADPKLMHAWRDATYEYGKY